MAIDPITGLQAGAALFGAVSNKKKGGNSTANTLNDLIKNAAKKVKTDDPIARINAAVDATMADSAKTAEVALGNVFAKFAQSGSMGYLPDTSRNSILRGTLADVQRPVALWAAQERAKAFDQWLQNVAMITSKGPIQQAPKAPFDYMGAAGAIGKFIKELK